MCIRDSATTGLAPSTAREVRLLVDGGHKYPALLAAIAQAREHIHLEYLSLIHI